MEHSVRLSSPWLSHFPAHCFCHRSFLGPPSLSTGGLSGSPRPLAGPLGGPGLSHEFLLSLDISRFAELDLQLSVAVPNRDLPGHWALEQVCPHGPLARARNTPSLASGTRCAGGSTFLGSCNKLFPLRRGCLQGVARGPREAQSRLGTFSLCQALGPKVQASGTVAPGHPASPQLLLAPRKGSCPPLLHYFSQLGLGI